MLHGRDVIDAWKFTIGIDIHSAQRVAKERAADIQVAVLTAGPGWVRVEVIAGAPKRDSLLLIAGRGLFEVARRDEWRVADGPGRIFLMLRTVSGEQSSAAAELSMTRPTDPHRGRPY